MAIEITEQEEQLILQLRRAEEEETRRRNSALKVLKTAYEFEAWKEQAQPIQPSVMTSAMRPSKANTVPRFTNVFSKSSN